MTELKHKYIGWNPWHGCSKISSGCKYCYVYRQDEMYGSDISSSEVRKTGNFDLPIKRKRDKSYKIESGSLVFTCFTSDFLVEEADEWRMEAWRMIRKRQDCMFIFFTKRIHRFNQCLPRDWGDGYENVIIGCTVENQKMADYRLPLFLSLPIKHKLIIVAPIIEKVDISAYLDESIEEVSVGGESGINARVCDYEWIMYLRQQCISRNITFHFHQTGARFRKDGRMFNIKRKFQRSQADKAGINFDAPQHTRNVIIPDEDSLN